MNLLTAEDLAKLVELEAAATPGQWLVRPREHDDWGWIRAEDGTLVAIGRAGTFAGDHDEYERHLSDCRAKGIDPYGHNAALIAAARNALPALLASSKAEREMREALEEAERALLIASQILTDDHKIALNGRRWGDVALVNLRAAIERTAPSSDSCGLRQVCQSMLDDHMTSETHHPGYVLVPKDAFEKARAALTPKDPSHE